MKKIIAVIFAFALLFCSCKEVENPPKAEDVAELRDAISATNNESSVSGKYMLEITFGDSTVLYYALGNVAWDVEKGVSSVLFDETYLGDSSVRANYFAENKLISVDDGEVLTLERDAETLFSKFPYAKLPEYSEEHGGINKNNSANGKTFTVKRTDTKELLDTVVGNDIYTIATVIKKPQPEKTQYSDTECIYTVSDGKVVGCRYEFDVKLFDTPAYIPGGYSVPESEYTLDLHVVAKVTYEKFGSDVTVSEYSETSETSDVSETSKN